ncbi:MAG: ExbD/TolR family protein [Bosea sp. (in: a-proteobacteria)]
MGMNVAGGGASGGRRRRAQASAPIADINMTPFIDVMLVLLIIFMVTAPLLTAGVPLDLPKTSAGQLNLDQKPVMVSINDKAEVYVGETRTSVADLAKTIQPLARQGLDERIYVRGAKQVDYGTVAQVMSAITAAGYKRVALVTEQDPQARR